MTAESGARAGSRAVLVGVSAYEYAELTPIRAARNSLDVMQSLLTDPELCDWPPELVTTIINPVYAPDMVGRIADLAEEATEVLLMYYVGHGLLSPRGQLCLSVTSTRPDRPQITGVSWDVLSDILRTCPARIRIAILDCCFAGQAIEALSTGSDIGLADITHIEGVYTLTATTRNRTAHVPRLELQDNSCTSFTGALRDLIQTGIPGRPTWLTFSDIYPVLRQNLRERGLPVPSQRGIDTAQHFPFTVNLALRTGYEKRSSSSVASATEVFPERNSARNQDRRSRCIQILAAAIDAAQTVTNNTLKTAALARVSKAMVPFHSDRATRLAVDAERIAGTITNDFLRAAALAAVAEAVVGSDPERGERIARAISRPSFRAVTLARIAQVVATTDGHRAARLAADAETAAQALIGEYEKAVALARVAEALAGGDPDHAEAIAGTIAQESFLKEALNDVAQAKAAALVRIAEVVAPTDLDRAVRLVADAECIARTIADSYRKQWTLARVAEVVDAVSSSPDRTERIVGAITDQATRDAALAHVAEAVASADPDRAESNVQTITSAALRAPALAFVAGAVAATDPDRAARLAADAERIAKTADTGWLYVAAKAPAVTDPRHASKAVLLSRVAGAVEITRASDDAKAVALAEVAEAVAAIDPARAARLARSITKNDYVRALAVAEVAVTVAAIDPDRAISLAGSIKDDSVKGPALARIAVAVAATNPDRAAGLAADAERLVLPEHVALSLSRVAEAVAAIDPGRAAELAAKVDGTGPRSLRFLTDHGWADTVKALAALAPDRAESIAEKINDKVIQAPVLAHVAGAVAATDVDRADRLATKAEHVALTITNGVHKDVALARVAGALAATAPDTAERIAQAVTYEALSGSDLAQVAEAKAVALVRLAQAMAATDSDRAAQLAADAERVGKATTDEYLRATTLARLAETVADTDPDHAELLALSIPEEAFQVLGLGELSAARAVALAAVARAVIGTNQDRGARLIDDAERMLKAVPDKPLKAAWHALVGGTVAIVNEQNGEFTLVAGAVRHGFEGRATQALVKARVAAAMTAMDPVHARKLAAEVRQDAQSIDDPASRDAVLIRAAQVLATDLDSAERIANAISHPYSKATALVAIAEGVAATEGL
jgi:Caspase domain